MPEINYKLVEWTDMLANAYRNRDWARVLEIIEEMKEYHYRDH